MKQSQIILNIIFGFAIVVLLILRGTNKSESVKTVEKELPVYMVTDSSGAVSTKTFPVAYIVLDSLMQNYTYYSILEKKYETMVVREEQTMKKEMEILEKDATEFQYNVQNGLITTKNAELKYAELQKREQQLMQMQQSKGMELARKEQELMSQLLDSVKASIAEFNVDGKFEIILNNASNVNVLYATEQLNITQDILVLMNTRYNLANRKK
jgi:outer membrane protein